MRSIMELTVSAYFTYASGAPLSLAAAAARTWAVEYAWANADIKSHFGKLELELYAAGLS
jgi:hypothetical protein